jgi:hypothetical protein
MISSNSSMDWSKFMSESEQNQILHTPEFREWMVGVLNDDNKTTSVTFTKKDGSTRTMRCTRNLGLIPQEFHPKGDAGDIGGAIRAFDLEKKEWRSFIPESVQRIDYEF